MNRVIFIIILFSVFCGYIFSQNRRELTDNEKLIFEQKLTEQSQKIETLQCEFVQEKTSVLLSEKSVVEGVLMYKSPSMLRWEYTSPTPSTLILNANNAILLDKNGQKAGDERMLKQLGSIIISMINGSGIMQNRQFLTDFYEIDNSLILVVLTPVQKRLKDFYDKIELILDNKTMFANEIILFEKSGDKMSIILTNKVLNAEIQQNKFVIQ